MENDKYLQWCAKSPQQRALIRSMLNGWVHSPAYGLSGSAKKYGLQYAGAFESLLRRLRAAGADIQVQPGSRGGAYSATYHIAGEPLQELVREVLHREGVT